MIPWFAIAVVLGLLLAFIHWMLKTDKERRLANQGGGGQ